MILWNVFYILNHNKHKKEGVKVGMGDDPDDYDEEDRSSYILGYLLWGLGIIILDILFLTCAINHADSFPPEDDDEMMKMMEEKEKKMEMMEKMMEADAEMAEGGQRERRAGSRSSSVRSKKSARSSQMSRQATMKKQATLRMQRAATFNTIDNNKTPRGSCNSKDISYENGKNALTIQFSEDNRMKVNKIKKSK